MRGLVVEKPGVIGIKNDVPEPTLSPYSAIVETVACGICNGTDLKMIDGHFKGFDTYPAVLGHESVGRVIETGSKVTSFKKGDMVMRTVLDNSPKYYSGWGSFSDHTVVYDYQRMAADHLPAVNEYYIAQQVLPPDIDPVKGIMIITFKEVLTGLKSFGVAAGQTIMVNGCGPVGLSMIRLARTLGVKKLIASDIDPKRRQLAGQLGADVVINAAQDDVTAKVRAEEKDGLDLFIDAVGVNSLMNTGLDLVKFNGKVGVYGISPACSAQIEWTRAPYNWTVQFVQWPNVMTEATLHDEVIGLVRSGYLDLSLYVTHVLPLQNFQRGLDLVRSKDALKVSLTLRS